MAPSAENSPTLIRQVFIEGDDLYEHMLDHIAQARSQVWLESYIFEPDRIGREFAKTLGAAAQRGVDVRLHLDTVGSLPLKISRLDDELRENGVKLKWFHRLRGLNLGRFNRRNHRKLLVIDDTLAYLGGFNIHDENSRRFWGDARWRDTHVAVTGQLAVEARKIFSQLWERNRQWRGTAPGTRGSWLVSNHSWTQRFRLWRVLRYRFRHAKQYIFITTPYFMPDTRTQRELLRAAKRGVKVKLLLPGETDRPLTKWVARAAYESMMKAGTEIFEFNSRMMHAKTLVIDGNWASVGSANMDYRSIFINYEVNLISSNHEFCERLRNDFLRDLQGASPIAMQQWSSRAWWWRLMERLAWSFRRWL